MTAPPAAPGGFGNPSSAARSDSVAATSAQTLTLPSLAIGGIGPQAPYSERSLSPKSTGTPSPFDNPTKPSLVATSSQDSRIRPSKNISIWKVLEFVYANSGTFSHVTTARSSS
jgi:hypothetical protein